MTRSLLGRVTMYRLVTIVLGLLAAVSVLLAAIEQLDPSIFAPRDMVVTLLVLLGASVGSGYLLALAWRRRPHLESSVITALLLWFLYWPAQSMTTLLWLAVGAVLANASKYLLAWRGRHVFNPAAAGAVLLLLVDEVLGDSVSEGPPSTTWWVASESLLPFVAVGALLVLYRTGRLSLAAAFVVPGALLTYWGATLFYPETAAALEYVAYSTPLVFFAGFMLSEPLTLPPRRAQQLALAVVAAAVFAWPVYSQQLLDEPVVLGPFEGTYELALIVVNLIAFALGQRGGVRLQLRERRPLGGDLQELVFEPVRPLRHRPGQYLELQVPHRADRRGVRRMFTVASPPGADSVDLAVRVPERASSFKQALVDLQPGDEVTATGVHGDFVWPRSERPVVLVAGGIGVTPFLSQLRAGLGHDAVLVYGVPGAEVPYRDELVEAGVAVVLVSPERPAELPGGWTHIAADHVSGALVREAVPDLGDRRAYVSGPPLMVSAVARDLRRHCAGVRTDHFTGY